MADIFSKERRSEIMSRIRSSGTTPERRLYETIRLILGKRRKILTNVRALPGQPDVVIPSLKLAILADGCFYHSCPKHGHIPKTNTNYWLSKFKRNIKRDELVRRHLRIAGFSVWRIWEHDLKGARLGRTYRLLARKLKNRRNKAPSSFLERA